MAKRSGTIKGKGHLPSAHVQAQNVKRSSVAPSTKVKKGK